MIAINPESEFQELQVSPARDRDGDVEVRIGGRHSTWLTLLEVHRLRDHLTSILQAAGVPNA